METFRPLVPVQAWRERKKEHFRLEHGTSRRGLHRDAKERSRGSPDRGSRLRWCEASASGSPYDGGRLVVAVDVVGVEVGGDVGVGVGVVVGLRFG